LLTAQRAARRYQSTGTGTKRSRTGSKPAKATMTAAKPARTAAKPRKSAAPKATKPRASDLKFQQSGKGGGTNVKAGRAAKAAYKAQDAARRLRNQERNNPGARRWTAGSQRGKQRAATIAARGTGYARGRKKKG
jgi:hypothetical protein